MGRTERSDLRSWTNCRSCRARIRRASVPLVAERSLIGNAGRLLRPGPRETRAYQVAEAMKAARI
jgi:hypothetical protein